eukprot:5160597-Pyramimonas_sp.AAC.1
MKKASLKAMVSTPRRLTTKHPASQTTDPGSRGSQIRHAGPSGRVRAGLGTERQARTTRLSHSAQR